MTFIYPASIIFNIITAGAQYGGNFRFQSMVDNLLQSHIEIIFQNERIITSL